jgi:hypothetical protein
LILKKKLSLIKFYAGRAFPPISPRSGGISCMFAPFGAPDIPLFTLSVEKDVSNDQKQHLSY